MPYKIGQLPSEMATQDEIADYLEVKCLLSADNSFSIVEAAEDNGFVEDEDTVETLEIDAYISYADALLQIDERNRIITNSRYPFVGEQNSISLSDGCSEYFKTIYTFLLFATRWKMGAERIIQEKDGTLLFERLCNSVLVNYFGQHAKGMVFGTGEQSNEKGFEEKIKRMLDRFAEKGYLFRRPDGDRNHQKDGKVDLLAFIPFNDSRKGHFIAFGQCKTGTSWREKLGQLNPRNFSDLFIQPPLVFPPVCIYMVSEACDDDWEQLARSSNGVLFDRMRIMQFVPDSIDDDLYNDIAIWIQGVKNLILKHNPDTILTLGTF